jgi:hypothetical protein
VKRTLPTTFTAVALVLGIAGCGPWKLGRDYQRVAEETEWQIRDSRPLFDRHSEGYRFERVQPDEGMRSGVSIRGDGKELFAYNPHAEEPSYFEDGGIFYYADYSTGSYGCKLVAYDLQAGKEIWRTQLKAIGPVNHSKYRNQVWIEPLDEVTVIVFGNEAYGKYIEIVDRTTGKTVGHKVFK